MNRPGRRVVDEFEADEEVVGKLQHGQAAKVGLRHGADGLVAKDAVVVERTV